MTDRCRKPLSLPKTPKLIEVERLTHLEEFQAIDRAHRTPMPVLHYYRYQRDAIDAFIKKFLTVKAARGRIPPLKFCITEGLK